MSWHINPCRSFSAKSYLYTYIRGAFNKTFFVQAFKIALDVWKFSMLLLHFLWIAYDWPVFMISRSNEQLQQKLEYTLLKPDRHCWWISKIQSGCEDSLEERYAITFCFKPGKNATETYVMLHTAFGASCLNGASVFQWQKRFKEGKESVRDDERCGTSKEVNTPELIGQRVRMRVRVTMLRFQGSSGRDKVGRGQHSSNRVSGISTRTMHQSTTPSLSQTIWPSWASRQFLSLTIVLTLPPWHLVIL